MPKKANHKIRQCWWKEAVAYQIYPRSFMDTNGDGIGDLDGITAKLDYIQSLGVDVIWICPMYKSPNDDNGYDISDYQDIMAEFGTMADFDRLLAGVHQRGMRLIIDLVVNHTSDEHPWFLESRASKDNPKRDWYVWRDGKQGREPNNWESIFKGSAWKHDETTDQYFLHLFSARQPDLNWENREVRGAIYDMMRWWLDKGIDGFRIDAICHMKKEPGLTDMPNPEGLEYVPSFDKHLVYDGLLDYVDDMCANVFDHYDIMTVGEVAGVDARHALEWVGEKHHRLNMIFQFEHTKMWEADPTSPLDVVKFKQLLTSWQKTMENQGWNALFLENHDVPRSITKWGDAEHYWRESATALAAMCFLMQGTPFIYQGEEIGMTNSRFDNIDEFNDVWSKNLYRELRKKGMPEQKVLDYLSLVSRDNSRTPMQWNASSNAGFSTVAPWLKVNPNYQVINVALQEGDPDSVLNFYRRLIALRKAEPALIYGRYDLIMERDRQIYAYTRNLDEQELVVICNLTNHDALYSHLDFSLRHEQLLLANHEVLPHGETMRFVLRPYEARVYRVK